MELSKNEEVAVKVGMVIFGLFLLWAKIPLASRVPVVPTTSVALALKPVAGSLSNTHRVRESFFAALTDRPPTW